MKFVVRAATIVARHQAVAEHISGFMECKRLVRDGESTLLLLARGQVGVMFYTFIDGLIDRLIY